MEVKFHPIILRAIQQEIKDKIRKNGKEKGGKKTKNENVKDYKVLVPFNTS